MLLFLFLIVKGYCTRNSPLWSKDYLKLLMSMKEPEWDELRLKLITETTLNNQELFQDDFECPDRLLSVLETLNCKNTSSSIEAKLQRVHFFMAYNYDPKVFDSVIKKNCSLIPNKYLELCQMYLTKKLPHIDMVGLISDLGKCYEEHKRASNISLSHR